MFVLVTLSSETFQRMMAMRLLHRRLGIAAPANRDASSQTRDVRSSFGGRIVLLDWRRGTVVADLAVLGAAGLAVSGDTMAVSSWIEPVIRILRHGKDAARVTHPWFNYVHSVQLTSPATVLLASAGSDLIAEIDIAGRLLWSWIGPEHGYGLRPDGAPVLFDRAAEYRDRAIATTEQAMHITSAHAIPGGTVLATLFHQGELIAIDRASGAARVVLNGLSRPHGVRRCPDGFLLSDTLGHRIMLLDGELRLFASVPFGAQWLQDTIVTSRGTYLTLENVHIEQLPEPGLGNRITEIDRDGRVLRSIAIPADFRLFTAVEIDGSQAEKLAGAWGRSGDFDDWRWA